MTQYEIASLRLLQVIASGVGLLVTQGEIVSPEARDAHEKRVLEWGQQLTAVSRFINEELTRSQP
jgi:hypothetical protein